MTEDQPKAAARPISGKHLIRLILSLLVVSVALYFLARVLYSNWAQVKAYPWRFDPPLLGVSYVALIASYLVDIGVWRQAVLRMGEHISYPHAARLSFAAGLAKYIPGMVWQFVGWFFLAQREGVSGVVAGTSIVLTQALSALAGALLAAGAFVAFGASDVVGQLVPLLIILPTALVILQPRVIEGVLNWVLLRLHRQPVHFGLTFRDLLLVFLFYLLSYGLWGLSLFLFANALTPLPWQSFIPFLGVFPAAYALGLIAPFAPAGLGVREAILTYLISLFIPLPAATVIALMARPWMMTVEVSGALIALTSYARQGTRSNGKMSG
jgi:uncharacterized membrane protein YbhN (UPF0104 family)